MEGWRSSLCKDNIQNYKSRIKLSWELHTLPIKGFWYIPPNSDENSGDVIGVIKRGS